MLLGKEKDESENEMSPYPAEMGNVSTYPPNYKAVGGMQSDMHFDEQLYVPKTVPNVNMGPWSQMPYPVSFFLMIDGSNLWKCQSIRTNSAQ